MHVLFVHSNFPAQFRCIAPRLARDYGWRCTFVTRNGQATDVPGVERVLYRPVGGAGPGNHSFARQFESTVRNGHGVYEAMKARPDVRPDLVVAHSGFGSSLFLPHLYDAPVVNFFEYFFRPVGQELGYRPEVGLSEADVLRSRTANAMVFHDLDNCARGWCPNFAQRDVFPKEYQPKLKVIPEGIDTHLYRRWPDAPRRLPDGTEIPASTRIVTYVSRGFEMMRGFDVFLRAAKRIYQQFPDVLFVVAGTDKAHYGPDKKLTAGRSLRASAFDGGEYDPSRFHFTGWLPEPALADLLSISDLHIYLTVPFITSWSFLDAMSCASVVLASDQTCTREYIQDGRNGLLCDFFDVDGMAERAVKVLRDPSAHRALGEAARATIEEKYSLDVCLPRLKRLFEDVAATPRAPSLRAELLVREPRGLPKTEPAVAAAGGPLTSTLAPFDGSVPYYPDGGGPATATPRIPPSRITAGQSKTILFAWEVGGGLGHLMQMRPLVEDLTAAGHCVVVALRHLDRAVEAFGHAGVFYMQAPYAAPRPPRFPQAAAYAPHLVNLGFGDDEGLFGHASAWRNLIRTVAPDLIVFDYAPTALLASRVFPVRRATIGSGFCMPPDDGQPATPDGGGRAWAALRPAVAARRPGPVRDAEAEVLTHINWVLSNWGRPPLARLGQLFADVDEQFLTTLPELDHFRERPQAGYWGPVLSSGGDAPDWPTAAGKRVFVYLKNSPDAEDVLGALKRAGCPTVAYVEGLSPAMRKRVEAPTVQLSPRRVGVAQAARECDLAVLNGGHGVTSEMLLAGKPMVLVPLVLEQQQTARAVERLGAGLSAAAREPYAIVSKLEAMLTGGDPRADAARRFADRYASFDRDRQRRDMFHRVTELLAEAGSEPGGDSSTVEAAAAHA